MEIALRVNLLQRERAPLLAAKDMRLCVIYNVMSINKGEEEEIRYQLVVQIDPPWLIPL
jgi:energy-converting hydrogenase A subunit M